MTPGQKQDLAGNMSKKEENLNISQEHVEAIDMLPYDQDHYANLCDIILSIENILRDCMIEHHNFDDEKFKELRIQSARLARITGHLHNDLEVI